MPGSRPAADRCRSSPELRLQAECRPRPASASPRPLARRRPGPRAASCSPGGSRRGRRCRRPRPAANSPGHRRPAVEIGDDAAHHVVRGRARPESRSRREVQPGAPAGLRDQRKPPVHERRIQPVQRQEDRRRPIALRFAHDGARDAIARREIPGRIVARHERLARGVDQARPLAAQRLRQQEPGLPRHLQRRRMKLDELEIGDGRPGPVRDRDAVAGRDRRVRRLAEDLPGAARRQQRAARARRRARRRPSCRNSTPDARGRPRRSATRRARARGSGRSPSARRAPTARGRSRGRSRRARAARAARCAPLRARAPACRRGRDRTRRPSPSARARSAGRLRRARATARSSHSPSPAAIVSARCRAGLSSGPDGGGNPALRVPVLPARGPAFVSTRTSPAPSSAAAARSAAMPLPIIRKSACKSSVIVSPVLLDVGSRSGRYGIHIEPGSAARSLSAACSTRAGVPQRRFLVSNPTVWRFHEHAFAGLTLRRADPDPRRRAAQEPPDGRPHLRRARSARTRIAPARSWRSAAACSATPPASPRPPICAASRSSRSRRRCSRRWTARSAARSASTTRKART